MRKALLRLHLWLGLAGLLCLVTTTLLGLQHRADSPEEIRERVGTHLSTDFRKHVTEATVSSQLLLDQFDETQTLNLQDGNVRLLFNKECRLQSWSNAELMPSGRSLPEVCLLPANNTYKEDEKIYYQLRHENERFALITLIPVQVNYRVQNSFLPSFIFLGRYNSSPQVSNSLPDMEVHLRKAPEGIQVTDANNKLVYSLVVPHPEIFTFQRRMAILILGGLSILLLLGALGTWLMRKISPLWAAGIMTLLLAGLRVVLIASGLPGAWSSGELFSPTLLAIDSLSPSLGDFTLNVVILLISLLMFSFALRGRAGHFFTRRMRGPVSAVVVSALAVLASAFLIHFFFLIFQSVLANSKIDFDFSNVFQLNAWSFLAFLDMGLLLVCLFLLLLRICKAAYLTTANRWKPYLIPILTVSTGLCLSWLRDGDLTETITGALSLTGALIVIQRVKGEVFFKLDFLNLITAVIVFSLLSTTSVMHGDFNRKLMEMEVVANRVSDEHDRITESLFDRVEKEVIEHTYELDFVIQNDTAIGEVMPWLEEKFLPNFKGYNVRLFLYDEKGELLTDNTPSKPYNPPGSGLRVDEIGQSTTSPHLRMVPDYDNIFERIYLGQFDLILRNTGRLIVQAELEPKEIQPNRLYPQLMLDDKVRNKYAGSSEFQYALYLHGRIFRKQADEAFPVFYDGDSTARESHYDVADGFLNFYSPAGTDRTVHVRTHAAGFFEATNLFSFVFYYFILTSGMFYLLTRMPQFVRNPSRMLRMSLRMKIQVFLLGITVLPLVTVVFFLSPYVKERIYEDMRKELHDETARVANLIHDDYLRVRNPGVATTGSVRILRNKMEDIEKTIFNDINIYDNKGRIHLTTQSFIFEMGLTSEYMNASVYEKMRRGEVSDMVLEDRIGNVNYFSGYYPLLTDESRIIGFLNIPYLKNPDKVNEQSLGLMTFLVDLYVVVFLAMGFIALIISNSITRPLTLLAGKLRALSLGKTNEPLQWNSSDEIGEIIHSYNQMLEKLSESEDKLARSEREHAWQQMARQVAHEIKNPLTPMKLSVQHLIRAWNEGGDRLPQMFEKVTRTLLVQMDSLVRIADSFSQFARMPDQNKAVFSLPEVIREVTDLYSAESSVQIVLDLPEQNFQVSSDRDQISRVFNNVIKNAIQAIGHDKGRVEVKMVVKDHRALVTVKDNGKGVPEDIRARIFEPNFSTKTSGMGLGLAIVKKIIEGADGKIYFESTPDVGTTFFIELPEANPAGQ